ncbi:MAG: hypothetical protein IJR65_02680 [Oscillospiraceae bacterium]|nr:hypothetical protein [Oscillospiraceae bacterium]
MKKRACARNAFPVCILYIILCVLLSGCGARGGIAANVRPLESLRLAETLGLDAGPTLSAAVAKTETEAALALSARAGSLPAAVDALREECDSGTLFLGHLRYVLLGPEAAREGLAPLLDYMERDVEMRLDTELVLLDRPAEEFVCAEGTDLDVSEAVDAAKREAERQGNGLVLDLRETVVALDEYGAAPVLLLHCEAPEGETPSVQAAGCGVLRTDGAGAPRLVGTLDRRCAETLGLLLGCAGTLTREADGATLFCRGGGEVELTNADPAAPRFQVSLRLSAAVAGMGDIAEAPEPETLARELEAAFQTDAEALFARLQALAADLPGLARLLRNAGVEAGEGWLERSAFAVKVDVTIDRSFDTELLKKS